MKNCEIKLSADVITYNRSRTEISRRISTEVSEENVVFVLEEFSNFLEMCGFSGYEIHSYLNFPEKEE